MCKMLNSCSGDYALVSKWKMFRPEPYRPLNDEDHQKIRTVTAWMWSQKDSLNPESFNKILKNNDFDKRFESQNRPKLEVNKEVEVPIEAIVRALKKLQYSDSFPKYCAFEGPMATSTSLCKTEVAVEVKESHVIGNYKMSNLSIKTKITREKDKKVFEQDFLYPITNDQKIIKLYQSHMGAGLVAAPMAMMANWPGFFGAEIREGTKSAMLYMMLDLKDKENPEVYQFIYQTYVWYSFEEKIVKEHDMDMKQILGYPTLIEAESETLFQEKELPFQFKSFLNSKMILSTMPAK